jgi:hypothetical protein
MILSYLSIALDALKELRARLGLQAAEGRLAHDTLNELDRITNHFQSVQIQPPQTSYVSGAQMRSVPRPTIHWHQYITDRGNEISKLSSQMELGLAISGTQINGRQPGVNAETRLGDSAPIIEEVKPKILAPIGTGRPGKPKNTRRAFTSDFQYPPVVEPEIHSIFRHMWFLMVKQEPYKLKHVWVVISVDPAIEAGAKDLNLPCLGFEQIRQVLLKEFPNLEQAPSPELSRSSSELSLTSINVPPSPTEIIFKHGYEDEDDEIIFKGKRNSGVPAGAVQSPAARTNRAGQRVENGITSDLPANRAQRSGQSTPRVPIEPRADRERREMANIGHPLIVDPESFDRSPRVDSFGRSRGGAASFVPRHQRNTRSGPDPPPNAPTGPRKMSGSSGNSKKAISVASPVTSPTVKVAQIDSTMPSRASQPNSPRQTNMQATRSRNNSGHRNGHRPSSRGGNSPAVPNSPRVGINNLQAALSPRVQRAPRQVYVNPRAREQQQARESTPAAATSPTIDLNQPIDPDSFGRGQIPPGDRIRVDSAQMRFNNNDGRRRGSPRGPARGRMAPGRGRGASTNERKLFDPS